MQKSIVLLFCIFTTAFLCTQAQRLRCRSTCRFSVLQSRRFGVCIIDEDGVTCRRLARCQAREENCRRQIGNQPLLRITSPLLCLNILQLNVPTRCTGVACSALICTDTSTETLCFRNPANQCQVLTQCQQQRLNCDLAQQNILTRVDATRCVGMRLGDALATCAP